MRWSSNKLNVGRIVKVRFERKCLLDSFVLTVRVLDIATVGLD